jgi:serine/threonine protein kinase
MAYFREITEHYRIEKPLGAHDRGDRGEGGVFRAADPLTGVPVTLKLIPMADTPPESAHDFVRAMGILQAIRHPSLPALFDFGFTPDGQVFLVLEYVDGRDALALQGGSPAQILPLLTQVLDGLERMAKEGLAHHNLCPENLLVVPGPAPGRIQMAGLGTAPLRPPGGRPEREAAAYAAPELGRPQEIATAPWRADLFSLALVACRLLEARVDGGGEGGDAGEEPRAPQVTLPLGVCFELEDDRALQEVLERSLHPWPEERPTFQEVRQAFGRALSGAAGARALPESRIFLSPEPEADPWLPLPAPRPVPPAGDILDDTNPVFPDELAPPPAPVPFPAISPPSPPSPISPLAGAGEPVRRDTLVVVPPLEAPPELSPEPAASPWPVEPEPELVFLAPLPPPLVYPAPAAAVTPAPPPSPPAARLPRYLLWGGAAAAALVVATAVGFFALRSREAATAAAPAPPAATRVPTPAPVPPPALPAVMGAAGAAIVPVPLPGKLAAARDAFAEGKEDAARQALASLTREEEAALTPEACNVYGVLRSSLDAAAGRASRAIDFRAALKAGDLPQLVAAMKSIPAEERAAIQADPGLRKELAAARQAVDLYQRYQRAARTGEPAALLTAAGALASAFPRFQEAAARREKTAASLEAEAETLFQTGAVDGTLERLETLRHGWPERAGLGERIARYAAEQRADQKMTGVLSAAAAAESRKRPDEGLAQLDGAKPTPRYEARFHEARARLESQLAQLDLHPPVVQLAARAADLDFEKGADIHIPLKITDDYQVKSVTVRVRPEGGTWTELPCNRSGTDCTVEVPAAFHQNRTVELYVIATDLSGHKGQLGSPEKPQPIRRKRWYDRLRGKG